MTLNNNVKTLICVYLNPDLFKDDITKNQINENYYVAKNNQYDTNANTKYYFPV